jgi:acyl-CoA thioesterase-1
MTMPDPSPLILAFGDSLIAGYGLRPDESLPARLQARLRATRPLAQVVNAGVSGDTTEGALRRLPRVLSALPGRPDLALVQIGPNDVLRAIPPERMRAHLEAILTEFERCAIPVLMATVAAPPFLIQRTEAYAGIHEAVAARHGATTCPFFPPGVLGHPDMVLWDRVHPNARAIALVAEQLAPAVERMLALAGSEAG